MSLPEEAGKVASNAIEAMRTNPSCLAALLLAAMFVVLLYTVNQREADRRAHTVDTMLERCFPTEGAGPR